MCVGAAGVGWGTRVPWLRVGQATLGLDLSEDLGFFPFEGILALYCSMV